MRNLIVVLEDDERRTDAMREILRKTFPSAETVFFDNAPDMIAWLETNLGSVRLLCLDHDLGPNRVRDGKVFDPGIGRDVADLLATREAFCPVLIHSTNVQGANGMQSVLEEAGWVVERVGPYGDLEWIEARWRERVRALGLGEGLAGG